jgi:crotonobetainyl-CoA:carnitine CoA-transferase CaiB-like acyl-CoA transferase
VLADLGAEVIKVEEPQGGDYIRAYVPACEDGNSTAFHALNRGKKSVTLDLKADADRALFRELARSAHVVLESFRPGVLARLGLGPRELLALKPSLVVCSISGYGASGPDRLRAGHDVNYLARAGVLGMMSSPSLLPVQVADICGGAMPAVIQILAALRRAERTGAGAVIDVSMTDSAASLLVMPLGELRARPRTRASASALTRAPRSAPRLDGRVGGRGPGHSHGRRALLRRVRRALSLSPSPSPALSPRAPAATARATAT